MEDVNKPKRRFLVIDWDNRDVSVVEGRKALRRYFEDATDGCDLYEAERRIEDYEVRDLGTGDVSSVEVDTKLTIQVN